MSSEYRSVFSFYEFSKHVHKHRGTLNTALHSCCHFTPVNLHDLHGAVLITKPRLPDIRHPDFNWFKKRLQTVISVVESISIYHWEQWSRKQCLSINFSRFLRLQSSRSVVKHMSPVYLSYTRPSTRRPYGTRVHQLLSMHGR